MAAASEVGGIGDPVSPFYIPATAAGSAVAPHVLKHGDCFAVLDRFGNAQATGPAAEGLFFEDTRYLSQLVLTIDGARPLLLSSSVSEDNVVLAADLANPDLVEDGNLRLAKDTIHILGSTLLGEDALFVQWELHTTAAPPRAFAWRSASRPTSPTCSSCAARCGASAGAA